MRQIFESRFEKYVFGFLIIDYNLAMGKFQAF